MVSEIRFVEDITPQDIKGCMKRDYFPAAFIINTMFKQWVAQPPSPKQRRYKFTASTAAFIVLPGYAAYPPTETATRVLADTLRWELLLY